MKVNLDINVEKKIDSILTLNLEVYILDSNRKNALGIVSAKEDYIFLDAAHFDLKTVLCCLTERSGRLMTLNYKAEQHREFLNLLDNVGQLWLNVFDHNTKFYSAAYWDLLTRIWREEHPVRRTDALRFMTSIKSASTAGKYIDEAIRHGFLRESTNPEDARSKLIELSTDMRSRLDAYLDGCIGALRQANAMVCQQDSSEDVS